MTLAKMATNRLNAQAPELSKFVIAFKELSDELPENTGIKVGMFIIEIAGKYIYVPALSKNDNVQPLESMYDADTKEFIPLTKKSVQWMIEKGHLLGTSERIPKNVAKDPSLYEAVVPPKTGKFVYASEGRVGGFFAGMPNHLKQAALEVITSDIDLQNAMAPVMKIDIVRDFLEPTGVDEAEEMGPPAPAVITSAEGLDQDQVQEIMSKGYTVTNPPKSTRIAVEASSSEALTTLANLEANRAYAAMRRDGSWVTIAGVRAVPGNSSNVIGVTEHNEVISSDRIVIRNGEEDYNSVMERLTHKSISDVDQGEYGMFFTGTGWIGPVTVKAVSKSNGWTSLEVGGSPKFKCIKTHASIRGMFDCSGSEVLVNPVATFYPMAKLLSSDFETDINTAQMKSDIEMTKMLPVKADLMHRNGVYGVGGREIGGKPQIIEHLLNDWQIDVPTAETLVKSAEANTSINVLMSKSAALKPTSSKPTPHYEQGEKLDADPAMTGDARQRALGMAGKAKAVKDVQDRDVMEATIISEMLQNPDMAGTIKEYLPDIKQAVDRLGRSLFLMRLNTNKLSDKIDAEAINNLFTATRNAYRIIGDNYVELQNLVATDD